MPYDRTWARSVYEKYAKICTRAYQINLCIRQLIQEKFAKNLLLTDIEAILIDSLQAKCGKTLWPKYKRLVKKMPLDKGMLEEVSFMVFSIFSSEEIARQFEFNF